MAKSRKTTAAAPQQQLDIETAIAQAPLPNAPAVLIQRYRALGDWLDEQQKRYDEATKAARDEQMAIKSHLLDLANQQGVNGFPTEYGTAYVTERMMPKIDANAAPYVNADGVSVTGREAVLDFCLEHWDDYGSEHLQVNFGVDGIRAYIEQYKAPPPGISVTFNRSLNIRKS